MLATLTVVAAAVGEGGSCCRAVEGQIQRWVIQCVRSPVIQIWPANTFELNMFWKII